MSNRDTMAVMTIARFGMVGLVLMSLSPSVATSMSCGVSTSQTPSGAQALESAVAMNDPEERKRLLLLELPGALCSPEFDLRDYAFQLLRHSRDLDITAFREALLCGDARDAEDERRSAEQRHAERLAEARASLAEDPESVSAEDLLGLESPIDAPRGPGRGESLLERWEYAHATEAQRIAIFGAAIVDGEAFWRRVHRISRGDALREACADGLVELRPVIEAWFGTNAKESWGECRILLGWLDSAAAVGADRVAGAISTLASMDGAELDARLATDDDFFCAFGLLRAQAKTAEARRVLNGLYGSQRPVILQRLRRQGPALSDGDLWGFAISRDRNVLPGRFGRPECRVRRESMSSSCGWAGW